MSEQEVFDALKYHIEVDIYGSRCYFNNANQLHRTAGPAIEYADGSKSWYQNDQRHRTDGPAIDWIGGRKEWYQNDKRIGSTAQPSYLKTGTICGTSTAKG
jgi:hypothetical protein